VLERACLDGGSHPGVLPGCAMQDTPLAAVLHADAPLHLTELDAVARTAPGDPLLQTLVSTGMRSAIALPISSTELGAGVLVLAARARQVYTADHLELLTNIAHLITHSLARTMQLVEDARLAAIGQLASGIVHEIRNPLTTISLALGYFGRVHLADPGPKWVVLATRELDRMARLLDDILVYAKPLQLQQMRCDLNALVEKFLATHGGLTEAKSQSFASRLAPLPLPTDCDADRLQQVLLNLARNACDAAPEHGVIHWSTGTTDDARRWIEVHNGGEPIAAAALPHLLEPFFTTKARGTGLGLSIVKRILDAHGGSIEIDSDAARGTAVRVLLPGLREVA
jgi:signal transduction histidine kinase